MDDKHWWALDQSVIKKEKNQPQSAGKTNTIWSRDLGLESGLHIIDKELHMLSLIHWGAKPLQYDVFYF